MNQAKKKRQLSFKENNVNIPYLQGRKTPTFSLCKARIFTPWKRKEKKMGDETTVFQ